MAEAFGLVAGVLQVAGFGAEVSSTLFKCAKKFHNASKDLEDIASKVETTSVSLRQVTALLKDPTTKALHTQKLYEDTATVSNGCLEVFHELDNYVKSFEPKSGFQKMTIRSKARWLFDGNKVHELGQVLRRYSDVLHLMISVMALVEGRRAATKEELMALEADLKVLALSNRDLSHSNKTLTDTIAAISQASVKPVVPKAINPPAAPSAIDSQAVSRAMPVTSLIAMPSVGLPPIEPRKQNSSDRMAEHLQRCMNSVQELALSISCALNTLYGHEKTGSSDIHGSYARLSTAMAQLPTHIQCDQCKQIVAWSHFEPAGSGIGQSGACKCRSQTPLQFEDFCVDNMTGGRDHDTGVMNNESIVMSHYHAQSLFRASQGEVRHELDHTAMTGSEAQAQHKGQKSDAIVFPTPQIPSAGMLGPSNQPCGSLQQRQLGAQVVEKNAVQSHGASEYLSPSTHYSSYSRPPSPPTHSLDPCPPIDISYAPPAMPPKDNSNDDHISPANKPPARFPSKTIVLGNAFASARETNPRGPQLLDLCFQELAQRGTPAARYQSPPTIGLPHTTQQSSLGQRGDGKSSHLDQDARDRALMMHKHFFQQQVAQQQLAQQQLALQQHAQQQHAQQQQQQQQRQQQQQQMQQMQQQQQQWNSRPLSNDFKFFDSRQQRDAPVSEDKEPLHQSTGYSTPLAQYQARLAELQGQNKKRLLMAREDQVSWGHQNIWSFSSNKKISYGFTENTKKITEAAIEDRRQDAASEPEHPAMPTPMESTGTYADDGFELNMDFADVSAGGGDALDNFDFDSFLNKDDGGMGFDFPVFDGGLVDGVGRAKDHDSQTQVDTENAPQHGQKRSRSDAFLGSPEHTPVSQRRKRRAISLSPRVGEVCESSVAAVELPTDCNKSEISTESLSGVEALLQRWFDASATAVLLRPSDG